MIKNFELQVSYFRLLTSDFELLFTLPILKQ